MPWAIRWALPLIVLACTSSDPKGPIANGCGYPHCDEFKADASKFVRNPAVKLRREYWALFEAGKGVAMFPRPDNSPSVSSECGRGSPTAMLLARNGICPPVDISKVNAMTLDDAFAVSTFLHARLRFVQFGSSVDPFPFTDDKIGVCDENPTERASVLRTLCESAYRRRASPGGTDEFVGLTPAEIEVIVPLLNKLYGVN